MSASGEARRFRDVRCMSDLPPIADIGWRRARSATAFVVISPLRYSPTRKPPPSLLSASSPKKIARRVPRAAFRRAGKSGRLAGSPSGDGPLLQPETDPSRRADLGP